MNHVLEAVHEFLSANPGVTVFIILIGVIGSIASIVSWRSSRKTEKIYKHLFSLAELNLDKTVTEEELIQKRKEVSEVSTKIVDLQEQIRQSIPLAAKRAVFEDRLDSSLELLKSVYDEVISIRKQLKDMGVEVELPEDLMRSIRSEIEPKHIVRERISKLKTLLSILTAAAAITATVLPYPVREWISILLLITAVPVGMLLLRLSFFERYQQRKATRETCFCFRSYLASNCAIPF